MKGASALLILITFPVMEITAATSGRSISLMGCLDKCGDVSIPYPFGIGDGCSAASLSGYFNITCHDTFQPPRPMLSNLLEAREITDISLERGEMRIYGPFSYTCFTSNTTMSENCTVSFTLEGSPFLPSTTRNRFITIGCSTLGLIGGYMNNDPDLYIAGCYSYCQDINSTTDGAPCTGMGYCKITVAPNLNTYMTSSVLTLKSHINQ